MTLKSWLTERRYPVELTCDAGDDCTNLDHPGYAGGQYSSCDLPTDDGTMRANVEELAGNVVGHRIVAAEKRQMPYKGYGYGTDGLVLTLDNGKEVVLRDSDDCCARTELDSFLLHPDKVDHVITGVGTTGGYTKWHIYADMGDVLELEVEWSCGNPFYYMYGFHIDVSEIPAEAID